MTIDAVPTDFTALAPDIVACDRDRLPVSPTRGALRVSQA
jgi:hypothetical protein